MAAAVRAAREVVRTKYPGDPTWLAYSLYAHPHAYVRFGPLSATIAQYRAAKVADGFWVKRRRRRILG